jgi:hypothetical protein
MIRRILLAALFVWIVVGSSSAAEPTEIQVYKSPTCGCCTKWVDHLRDNGFSVTVTELQDVTPIKLENGVPNRLASCHTAIAEGYIVEGHVPAVDIRRLLSERPKISGLAVPGMPIGSPGMEGPNPERYQVLSFGADGTRVFSEHGP